MKILLLVDNAKSGSYMLDVHMCVRMVGTRGSLFFLLKNMAFLNLTQVSSDTTALQVIL